MKKLFVISMVLVATMSIATAQQRRPRSVEERAKSQTERLDKLVTLTAAQKTKLEAINLDLAKQTDAKMQSNRGNRDAIRTAVQELDKTRDAKYREVMTEEQFKKYSDNKLHRQRATEERRRSQR